MSEDDDRCGDEFVFFFSSRRRHTRCSRDWSSDVSSSDLIGFTHAVSCTGVPRKSVLLAVRSTAILPQVPGRRLLKLNVSSRSPMSCDAAAGFAETNVRSEERRVGKECRCGRWGEYCRERK